MRALQSFAKLNLPNDWLLCPLKEILDLVYGWALPEGERTGSGFPVFGSNGIVGYHSPPEVHSAGIIVGRKGTAGAVTWSETPFTPIDTTYFVQLRNPDYSLRWAYHLLDLANLPRLAAATGVPGLTRSDPMKLLLPVPSRPEEQRAIAATLGRVDESITSTQAAISAAERLQRGLMRELLSGRIRPDGSARNANEFTDDERGPLPQRWTWARVKEFGEVSTGKTPPTESAAHFLGEIPFITPGDMGRAKWIQTTERTVAASGAKIAGELPAKTVCVVCIGATIGKVGLTTRPSTTNQQINSVLCSDRHSPEYLYYALLHRARHILAIAGVNATPQLNKSEFSKFRLPMPADRDEEEAIAAQLSSFDDLIEAKRKKILALQRLKKSLMQNLLTGRMRLPAETIAALNAGSGDEVTIF